MKKEFNYDKNKVYVIGVSGGPDSMALLHMLIKQKYNLIVCNVNYNTRKESSLEQEMVKKYCLERSITFEGISVNYSKLEGNFEAWARDIRYQFFKETLEKYNADALMVAHHKDDLLETYLIQKQRRNITKYFGLKKETFLLKTKVIRPLLDYYKEELLDYCNKNNIPYSIDSTNLENDHLRNKIRNQVLAFYSKEDKEKLLMIINKENIKRMNNLESIKKFLCLDKISIDEFNNLEDIEKKLLIHDLIVQKCPDMINRVSLYRINECIKLLKSDKPNVFIKISGTYYFIREYNFFYVDKLDNEEDFEYIMKEPSYLDTKEFSCDFRIDTSYLKITKDSYPLTFRNIKEKDVVKIGEITKKVNRLLIDEKVPLNKRKKYPVVVDKNNKIVYIPLYRSQIQKSIANKLMFVLK
ncbi:MAG: tRNA lysidine(34) synthetase TilS [Erysipelotrichaceae bacterium]|nr:tRNA lysidine(34) synthetase TilS [Erysipelotrichaceae bacterium]